MSLFHCCHVSHIFLHSSFVPDHSVSDFAVLIMPKHFRADLLNYHISANFMPSSSNVSLLVSKSDNLFFYVSTSACISLT